MAKAIASVGGRVGGTIFGGLLGRLRWVFAFIAVGVLFFGSLAESVQQRDATIFVRNVGDKLSSLTFDIMVESERIISDGGLTVQSEPTKFKRFTATVKSIATLLSSVYIYGLFFYLLYWLTPKLPLGIDDSQTFGRMLVASIAIIILMAGANIVNMALNDKAYTTGDISDSFKAPIVAPIRFFQAIPLMIHPLYNDLTVTNNEGNTSSSEGGGSNTSLTTINLY